jgi:hypothetical protein
VCVNCTDLVQGPMVGSCEHGNEPSFCIKGDLPD